MQGRSLTDAEREYGQTLLEQARAALAVAYDYTQAEVDRFCQAAAWAVANEATFAHLMQMSLEESGMGDPESRMSKRFRVMGILRDVLRQRSVGVIEEDTDRGIVKYAKPVGAIASLIPATNPELTPPAVRSERRLDPRRPPTCTHLHTANAGWRGLGSTGSTGRFRGGARSYRIALWPFIQAIFGRSERAL
jgi:hypothetical protein